jgi:hypothetical protein
VRLHVGDPPAGHPAEGFQGTDLVQDVVTELVDVVVDPPSPETGQVAVADLGADRDPPVHRGPADPVHGGRVAGVEAARHVRRGHDVEQGPVVAEGPATEALAEVRVQVNRVHGTAP